MALKDARKLVESLTSLPEETEWLEFKKGNFDPDEFGEYVSALANSAMLHNQPTAFLLFGVDNKSHEIVGTNVHLATEKVKGGEPFEHWLQKFLSPKIKIAFEWCQIEGKHVEIVCIEPAYDRPVRFNNIAYIRVQSIKKRLIEYPEIERTLWQLTSRFAYEEGIADTHVSEQAILRDFDCETLCDLLYQRRLTPPQTIEALRQEGLVHDDLQGAFDVTNLFALSAARDLRKYKTISSKAVRVITYAGSTKETATADISGVLGYAVAFQKILAYIMKEVGGKETLLHGVRKFETAYPELAVREFLANALIHQDLIAVGRPTVEIFDNKIQFINPGAPLVELQRLIDAPAKSRNEKLAGLMRKARLCEERGSGIDRALWVVEDAKLAPPNFAIADEAMIVTMYGNRQFAAMSREDRLRACYQHASLRYLEGAMMSNGTLRSRLGLSRNQYPQASKVINEATDARLIRPLDADQGNRNARYVPYWA